MSKSINQTFGAKIAAMVAVAVLVLPPAAAAVETDAESGLIVAPGWDTVKTNCTVCHSAQFITWQRGDRETWLSMIRWMQKTQGLWQLPPDTENTILDYLATNYPPGKASRRKNLPPAAMPANN
jgi:cytochrome c5